MKVREIVRSVSLVFALSITIGLTLFLGACGGGGTPGPVPLGTAPAPGPNANTPTPASASPQFAVAGLLRTLLSGDRDGLLLSYRIDSTSGTVTAVAGSPFRTGRGNVPSSTVFHPSGRFLYAAEEFSGRAGPDSIAGYSVDQSSGVVASVPGSPLSLPTGKEVYAVTIHPTGNFLYVAGIAEVYAFAIDQSTGAFSPIDGSPYATADDNGSRIAFATAVVSAKGDYLFGLDGFNRVWVYGINQSSGALTRLPGFHAAGSPPTVPERAYYVTSCDCMATDPTGRFLYVANGGSNNVSGFAIAANGMLSPAPGSPYATGDVPSSVEVDSSGKFAYVSNFNSRSVSTYQLDSSTGALTTSGTAATGDRPIWLDIDRDGQFVYTANWGSKDISAFRRDSTTGALSPLAGSPFSGDAQGGFILTISTQRRK